MEPGREERAREPVEVLALAGEVGAEEVKIGLGMVEEAVRVSDRVRDRAGAGDRVRAEVDAKKSTKCKLPQIVDYRF